MLRSGCLRNLGFERLERIDEARAILRIGAAGAEMLGGLHQKSADLLRSQRRFVGDQQGRDAAHIRGRDGCPGCKLNAPVGRRHENIHARRRDGDVAALVGAVEHPVVFVGRRNGHDAGIGARIERRRFRTGVTRGGDQQDSLLAGDLQRLRKRRIGGPAKLMFTILAPC